MTEVEVASYYGNWDKLQPDGPLGSYTDLTYDYNVHNHNDALFMSFKFSFFWFTLDTEKLHKKIIKKEYPRHHARDDPQQNQNKNNYKNTRNICQNLKALGII